MNANASNFSPADQEGYYTRPVEGSSEEYYGSGMHQGYNQNYQGGEYYEEAGYTTYPTEHGNQFYEQNFDPQGQYADPSGYGDWNVRSETEPVQMVERGFYYPSGQLAPQLYSAPVSAIAYDDVYAAMYVSSHTQPFGERPRRASMLVTHSTIDGMLYSSCGGHPEGEPATLQTVYRTFFGGRRDGGSLQRNRIPPHCYKPPYGDVSLQPQSAQIGITTLLPAQGCAVSVSPAGARLHSHGGLCMSDQAIEGLMCGTPHPNQQSGMTHVTVGGVPIGAKFKSHLYCLDLYQNMRAISSQTIRSNREETVGIMAMATNHAKQSLVAGCSDGTIRLFDGSWRGRGGAEVAKIKSHAGGVTDLSVSEDGTLICTSGFGAKSSSSTTPYAYPDPNIFIYDVRYLGRGGIPHTFAGTKGGPRFVEFMPHVENHPRNRLMAASGQNGGELQIIAPFDTVESPASFMYAQLQPEETISCMCLSGQNLALGTSFSNIHQYELEGFKKSTAPPLSTTRIFSPDKQGNGGRLVTQSSSGAGISQEEKEPLEMPDYMPPVPPLSIHPNVLRTKPDGSRIGANDRIKSVFSSYIMCGTPKVSSLGVSGEGTTFGAIAEKPILPSGRRIIAKDVLALSERGEADFMGVIPTSKLGLNILENHSTRGRRKKPLQNPNKCIYSSKVGATCYSSDSRRGTKEVRRHRNTRKIEELVDDQGRAIIPARYKLALRPSFVSVSHYDHTTFNDTGIWPGWDFSPSMPSSHAPSVLLLLYFIPEVRSAMLQHQADSRLYSSKTVEQVPVMSTELGLLFHHVEALSRHALTFQGDGLKSRVGAFVPSSLLTAFITMPEAEQLALLDDNPAVADKARRPEAFYRFLLYHLDKESEKDNNRFPSQQMDSLHGIDFLTANEFITGSGPPTVSATRALTVDLSYDPFLHKGSQTSRFGEVLRHALCRETRLRAWCKATHSYETVVQRKIATSLPKILSLSCACAGRKEGEGLGIWRGSADSPEGHWLPEMIEVELEQDGSVVVREQNESQGAEKWLTFKSGARMPAKLPDQSSPSKHSKYRYRLEAVLSFVVDEAGGKGREGDINEPNGHHVLHVRVPPEYKMRSLKAQQEECRRFVEELEKASSESSPPMTLTAATDPAVVRKRLASLTEKIGSMEKPDSDSWVLFNGFVVTSTVVEDARAFHVPFKEPCIVVYRAIEDIGGEGSVDDMDSLSAAVSPTVMFSRSISNGRLSKYAVKHPSELPGDGDVVAFDAEFVSVQEEESVLNDSGNKITTRETRHALARVSVIDCRTGHIIIDDYVVPREPVVDYLTRFSGIVAGDLDPKHSPHHLVTMRTAYLKLRCLMERGCIFLGHGLGQDFLTVNLFVPPNRVIDTVELYHKDRMRHISLRFLANYVLQRDMQQDVHDSVEDARAAFDLYKRAVALTEAGTFQKLLDDLYEYGAKTDWRIGVDEA